MKKTEKHALTVRIALLVIHPCKYEMCVMFGGKEYEEPKEICCSIGRRCT